MNKTKRLLFVDALRNNKIFTRLEKVTTMLPPPTRFTNRLQHTLDVVDVSRVINENIIDRFKDKHVYNFEESCYVHDLGHCCFAHEAEETINSFIANKLCVFEDDVCFSHAINGALVFAFAAKPNKYKTTFSALSLYKKGKKDIDVAMIVDSIIKHSFSKQSLGAIYPKYINREYMRATGQSLFTFTSKDNKPLFKVGYYVRVADDIASKNSDFLDLLKLYYGKSVCKTYPPFDCYYLLANKYIKDLVEEIIKTHKQFDIEDCFKELEIYKRQKSLLRLTYSFDYKKEFTTRIKALLAEIMELVFDSPKILGKYYNQKLGYIRRIFKRDIKKYKIGTNFDNKTINLIK